MTRTPPPVSGRAGRALLVAVLLLVLLPAVAHTQAPRIDLRIPLVTDGTPAVEALRGVLDRVGTPSTCST